MSNPVVTITMEDGSVMKAELYPEIAPNTVRNFISLIDPIARTFLSMNKREDYTRYRQVWLPIETDKGQESSRMP